MNGAIAAREFHDRQYGAGEPAMTMPYLVADALTAARDAGLCVEDVIEQARQTIAGDDEYRAALAAAESVHEGKK